MTCLVDPIFSTQFLSLRMLIVGVSSEINAMASPSFSTSTSGAGPSLLCSFPLVMDLRKDSSASLVCSNEHSSSLSWLAWWIDVDDVDDSCYIPAPSDPIFHHDHNILV